MSPNAVRGAIPYSRPSSPKPPAQGPQIGFVGLGNLGYPMARNLAQHSATLVKGSPPLLVWNRTTEKSEKLVKTIGQDKVHVAQDLGQIVRECDVIITNLANDEVVKMIYSIFEETLTNSPPTRNKIFVETSTIYPSLAGELDKLISSNPYSHLITCPVFGVPAAAEKAQMVLIMSGDYRSKKEIAYLLVPAVGRKIIDLGENVEKAPTFKLIGNSMILSIFEALAEAYTIAEKCGISAENVHNLVKEIIPAPGIVAHSDRMAHDNFDGATGFAIDGGIKDASHIRRLTAEHNSPMPAIDVVHQHLLTARGIHAAHKQAGKATFDSLDCTGLIAGVRVAAGLDGFDSQMHESVVREGH